MNSDLNGLTFTGLDNTKTRRPQPRSNTKNDRVPSVSKSSRSKHKEAKVEEHHRNLLLSKKNKRISSACNNSKIDSQDVISKVVSAKCKKCLIFVNHDKCNRLMRIDELHKFNDGTLTDVRTALDDRLKGIRMKYLPQTIWRKSDKERAAAMIQAIDKQLKTRRIMRSMEMFVGGRLYEGDFQMLQQTI
nr:hypothetical protein [Tanacetum cinerariifolium]